MTASTRGRADADTLAALLPAALGDWQLTELDRPQSPAPRGPHALVTAVYERAGEQIEIVVDRRPGHRAASAREVYREGPPQRDGFMVVIGLSNGVSIAAKSQKADVATLEQLLHEIDLAKAEALKPVAGR